MKSLLMMSAAALQSGATLYHLSKKASPLNRRSLLWSQAHPKATDFACRSNVHQRDSILCWCARATGFDDVCAPCQPNGIIYLQSDKAYLSNSGEQRILKYIISHRWRRCNGPHPTVVTSSWHRGQHGRAWGARLCCRKNDPDDQEQSPMLRAQLAIRHVSSATNHVHSLLCLAHQYATKHHLGRSYQLS